LTKFIRKSQPNSC